MWLTGRLVPDRKTIADFRKDNGEAIRKVCARFIVLCRGLGLFGEVSIAIDGSKFKAVNNRDKNFHPGEDGATLSADRGERCPLGDSVIKSYGRGFWYAQPAEIADCSFQYWNAIFGNKFPTVSSWHADRNPLQNALQI
jgi:hypothetical protein